MVIEKPLIQKSIKIQDLNRVALNPELLENLKLKKGDKVDVFLDTKKEEIIIRKSK
jgi:bifunctional DNA-binding transcriptional regulator/antitoxin component of YhaV-PrlF toxin-antitoxin module